LDTPKVAWVTPGNRRRDEKRQDESPSRTEVAEAPLWRKRQGGAFCVHKGGVERC
jgi:hypothetical protein